MVHCSIGITCHCNRNHRRTVTHGPAQGWREILRDYLIYSSDRGDGIKGEVDNVVEAAVKGLALSIGDIAA